MTKEGSSRCWEGKFKCEQNAEKITSETGYNDPLNNVVSIDVRTDIYLGGWLTSKGAEKTKNIWNNGGESIAMLQAEDKGVPFKDKILVI